MSKQKEVMEEITPVTTADTATAVAVAAQDCAGVDLTGVNTGDCGPMPWAKFSRKAGTITVNALELLDPASAVPMLVIGNLAKTFVSYDSPEVIVNGKKTYPPRAKYENKEGEFASAEAEAIAAGETVPNQDGSWPDQKAPTAVPAINLRVLIEDESGAIAIGDRYFTQAMLSLGKKDYTGVATRYFGGLRSFATREGFRPFMMEFSLSVCDKDKYDNYYLLSKFVKFHQPDSEFAKAAILAIP